MANSDKDIIITPNRGQSDDPKIEFRGANTSVGAQTISARVYPTSNGTLSFEGTAGQLFSITNSLSGTIFSVNDVSGIPSIEVLDSGILKFGQYSGNVLIGTATDNGNKLRVAGTAHITQLGVGSNNNQSFDFYNSGTSYFNGTAFFDKVVTFAGNSGSQGWSNIVIDASTPSNGAYIRANRASSGAGEVGYAWGTGGTNQWINFLPTDSTTLSWYQGSSTVMTLTTTGALQLNSTTDGMFTLSKSGTNWNYINFNTSGARKFYFGVNASNEPELGVDNNGTFRLVGSPGMTISGNTVYHGGNIPTWNQNTTGTAAGINTSAPTLAIATEANSIYVSAPSYSTGLIVKQLNFDWYGNYWAIGNIRSGNTASDGFGVAYGNNTPLFVFSNTGNGFQAGNAFTYDNSGGWGANLVAAGSSHARVRLRATSYNGSGDRETYMWLDNTTSPATGIYSTAPTFNFVGSITTVQVAGNTVLHAGNYTSYAATSGHNHTYNVNNDWLRDNGDDNQFKIYGNSRTIIYRTDGNTNEHGGGNYAHIFYYGGSADGNRVFIINTDGRLWSPYHGWLDTMSVSYASSAGTADNIDGWGFVNTGNNSAVNANTIDSNGISYYQSGVDNFSLNSTDGALYSQRYSSDWQHQIAGDYREGNIAVRGKNGGTWARWKPIPTLTISDTAPGNETVGDMWWESDTGKLKIYYYDGNTSQWVDAMPIPDTSTFFSKAGGSITGAVTINSSLTVTGRIYADAGIRVAQNSSSGLASGIDITNTDIRSNAVSAWTGNPGAQGKIQYHSYRWYIVSDSSSDRIVQFRRDGSDVSYIDNSGNYVGNVSGNATTATTASAVAASAITGQTGMWTSSARPGPYRLYRRDDNSDYSVQTHWTGSYWRLYGYAGDTAHADTHVGYADSAGNGGVTSVNGQTGAVTISGGASLSNDTSTNNNLFYPTMAYNATSGTLSTAYVSSTKLYFNPSTGTLSATVMTSISDRNVKENIVTIENALSKTLSLRGVNYTLKDTQQKSIGVIAQEVEEILPEVVNTSDDGTKSVQYGNMIGLLIEAIKEQQSEIEELKTLVKKMLEK